MIEWPALKASSLRTRYSYCILCKQNFKIEHGGRDESKKHTQTVKHAKHSRAAYKMKNLIMFVADSKNSLAVMSAELKMVLFIWNIIVR